MQTALNKEPDKMTTDELVQAIRTARNAYYNSGEQVMSDLKYDRLEDELRRREPDHPIFRAVGADVQTGGKVTLPYHLPSLDKVKEADELEDWLDDFGPHVVVMDKVDGVSLLVVSDGGDYSLYTRGNGSVGQDVTHLVPVLGLPNTRESFAVRCEIFMPIKTFQARYSGAAANPRNLVSGVVNRKRDSIISQDAKDVKFVAYELVYPDRVSISQQLKRLKKIGFPVVFHRLMNDPSVDDLNNLLTKRKQSSEYDVDGLVITSDAPHRRSESGNPAYSIAYKSLQFMDRAITVIRRVEWNVSKDGYLKPRLEIEPVVLAGATIKWATGFNYKFVNDNKLGPGAEIEIVRSGDVIPHVERVVTPAKEPDLPQDVYRLTSTGVDAVLVDSPTGNTTQLVKQVDFFMKSMGIENISTGTITQMVNYGWKSLNDFIHTKEGDLLSIPRFGERKAAKLVQSIYKVLWQQPVKLVPLMASTGFFGRGVGKRVLEPLVAEYPNLLQMYPRDIYLAAELTPGIGSSRGVQIARGVEQFNDWLEKSGLEVEKPKQKSSSTGKSLSDQVIVWTGFRSKDQERAVESAGGSVGGSVTRKTTVVVYRGKESRKVKDAQSKGIPVMTEDDFIDWLKSKGVRV